MNTVSIYKCLCDLQRLRIFNLLSEGPLCVCHLTEILETDQVKMSKQLRYMKALGMVEAARAAQWMVYRLAEPTHPLLDENLKCLQDCANEEVRFAEDLARRRELLARLDASECRSPSMQIKL
ncbi:MAG: ArsR family transcriptional regulator [Puniceicoccaceae bacterium]|nr:MAG: ArsR family transcriptional regulator [Puniceicoccaceae bacterium]